MAAGLLPTPEPSGKPGSRQDEAPIRATDGRRKNGKTREEMIAMTRERERRIKAGELQHGSSYKLKTKFSRQEVIDAAIENMLPKAFKVLSAQLSSPDERIRQAAAIKVIEYKLGKPTQQVKAEIDQRIATIRFETHALGGGEIIAGVLNNEEDEMETEEREQAVPEQPETEQAEEGTEEQAEEAQEGQEDAV